MSADNWDICPKCLFESGVDIISQEAEEYRTFREDYEFYGAEDGVLQIHYKGHCTVCGIGLNINETHTIWKP